MEKSLNGETDLDLLVSEEERQRFELVLKKYDFKQVLSPPSNQLPDVYDYLGLDLLTGRLIHLHVHYKLVMGEKYIKNHHLPIERFILANVKKKSGVIIPCPEIEIILLIIRANMKMSFDSVITHMIKNLIGKSHTPYPADIESEIRGLISECDIEKMKRLLRESKLSLSENIFAGFIDKFSKKDLKVQEILRWRRQIIHSLKGYMRETSFLVTLRYYVLCMLNIKFIKKFFKSRKKTLIARGRIISIIGADGSGKSTLVADLTKWFSWKVDVKKYYYGIPKNRLIKTWTLAIRGFNKLRLKYISERLSTLLYLYLAYVRFNVFRKTQKEVLKGRVVITDRFPLKDFRSMEEPMDGPKLAITQKSRNSLLSLLENNFYNKILLPDKIFVLQVELAELRKRKSNLELSKHKAKSEAVNSIVESPSITIINANRPYSDVLIEVKKMIWEII